MRLSSAGSGSIKRAAPDSDEPQLPDLNNQLSFTQQAAPARVITRMLAYNPRGLWEHDSRAFYGLLGLVTKPRHASMVAPMQDVVSTTSSL